VNNKTVITQYSPLDFYIPEDMETGGVRNLVGGGARARAQEAKNIGVSG